MATFTMMGPNGAFPGALQPEFPQFSSVQPAALAKPGVGYNGSNTAGLYTPIQPLPGAQGASSIPL